MPDNNITIAGDEKEKLYSEADIFLLPTYYLGEGQPISIIEALSYGLPVISTNFRGIPEQIKNNENGIPHIFLSDRLFILSKVKFFG